MQRSPNVIALPSGATTLGLEEAWAAEVARGASPEALVRLAFERCADMVFATAWRIGGSRFEAEDVCQSVFLALLDHAGSLRDPARVPGFLKTCAVRESLRLLRRRGWWSGRRGRVYLADREAETSSTDAFAAARVEQLLDKLGAEERAALVLKAQGHSHEEIAELLGTSLATARRRFEAARRKLAAIATDDEVGRAMLDEIGGEG